MKPTPTKKPAASERDYYIGSFVRHLIQKADSEKDSKKRAAFLERAMIYVRSIRRDAGSSKWVPLWFAVGSGALVVVLIFWLTRAPDRWNVLERVSDYDHTLQQIHNGRLLPPVVIHWCQGEPQPFEPGQTLTELGLEYHKDNYCHTTTKFSLLRDAAHCPKVPNNCSHTNCTDPQSDHILCVGKPQFD